MRNIKHIVLHNIFGADTIHRQFIFFSFVGVIGLVVDATTLLVLIELGSGPFLGRIFSYLVAATTTWYCNRTITFKTPQKTNPLQQWIAFVTSQLPGAALNLGIYTMLVIYAPFVARHPEIGVAAGSIGGLLVNFTVARLFVFQRIIPEEEK